MQRLNGLSITLLLLLSFLSLGSVQSPFAPGSTTLIASAQSPNLDSLPYYSSTFSTQRQAIASLFESEYNTTYNLIAGTIVDCGNQPNGFSLIDANFFAGPALQEYNPNMANSIISSVNSYLAQVNYQHNDRREVIFGNPAPYPPLKGYQLTVLGNAPTCPNGGKNVSSFYITTELPDSGAPQTKLTNAMNYLVVAGLQRFQSGDITTAQSLFNTALGWWTWNSTYHGFLSPSQLPCPPSQSNCPSGNTFNTRDLAYFLFFERATRFPVSSIMLSELESTLWAQQTPSFGGGLATVYNYNGTSLSIAVHTSNEINALALLAYDPRIQTSWFPGEIQNVKTSTSLNCQPSMLVVNSPTSCEAIVSNNDNSISLLPTGSVSFSSNNGGSFGQGGSCVLSLISSNEEGCSITFTPASGSEGGETVTSHYLGDTYHANSTGSFGLSVTKRTTQTFLSCNSGTVAVNVPVTCKITINDNDTGTGIIPSGSATVSSNSFSPSTSSCVLSLGTCSLSIAPIGGSEGTRFLTASYAGDSDHSGSGGGESLSVTQRTSSSAISCVPNPVKPQSATTCTVTVQDSTGAGTPITPSGTVSFSAAKAGKFGGSSTCTLASSAPGVSKCSVTFTPSRTSTGKLKISSNYLGDQDHSSSKAQITLKVKA